MPFSQASCKGLDGTVVKTARCAKNALISSEVTSVALCRRIPTNCPALLIKGMPASLWLLAAPSETDVGSRNCCATMKLDTDCEGQVGGEAPLVNSRPNCGLLLVVATSRKGCGS